MTYEVAVVGLGGIGSAILAHCASRGAAAIGIEQFERGHELGASSGKSRMIRQAYFEDSAYVPLVLRAYELWEELERKSGDDLLRRTGVLAVGNPQGRIIQGIQRASREHGLALEVFDAKAAGRRYPTLRLLPDELAILESGAGVIVPERAVDAYLRVAEEAGAEMRFETAMKSWQPAGENTFCISRTATPSQ